MSAPFGLVCMLCGTFVAQSIDIRDQRAHDALMREHEKHCPMYALIPEPAPHAHMDEH